MTPIEISRALAICEAATEGPWRESRGEVLIGDNWALFDGARDARFIAFARSALPAALARIGELEEECERLRGALRSAVDVALDVRDLPGRETYRGYLGELRRVAESSVAHIATIKREAP